MVNIMMYCTVKYRSWTMLFFNSYAKFPEGMPGSEGGDNGFCVENLTRKSCVSHYVSPRLCQKSTVAQSSNVAMENDPFVDDLPTKKLMSIFMLVCHRVFALYNIRIHLHPVHQIRSNEDSILHVLDSVADHPSWYPDWILKWLFHMNRYQ